MLFPIPRDSRVIEPATLTSLLLAAADVTELLRADASHMVATVAALDHAFAARTGFPTCFFAELDEFVGGVVFGTFLRGGVVFLAAEDTGFCFAARATRVCAACFLVDVEMGFSYPFTTVSVRAVNPVFSDVLFVFAVPGSLKVFVKEVLHRVRLDATLVTTFWWHLCGIFDRFTEHSLKTCVAPFMSTFQCLDMGLDNIFTAYGTFSRGFRSRFRFGSRSRHRLRSRDARRGICMRSGGGGGEEE